LERGQAALVMIQFVGAILILAFTLSFARTFYYKQNVKKALGGPVSVPKALWLGYATGSWFLIPFLFVFVPELNSILKILLIVHLVSWWVRGPLELVMIYKWLNWTPVYGITHDAVHNLVLAGIFIWGFQEVLPAITPGLNLNFLAFVYLVVTFISIIFEIAFAYLFRKTRVFEENADLIYFASTDPRYLFINRLTLGVVIFVYAHVAIQIFALGILAFQ
jgi:hypothetical protein